MLQLLLKEAHPLTERQIVFSQFGILQHASSVSTGIWHAVRLLQVQGSLKERLELSMHILQRGFMMVGLQKPWARSDIAHYQQAGISAQQQWLRKQAIVSH